MAASLAGRGAPSTPNQKTMEMPRVPASLSMRSTRFQPMRKAIAAAYERVACGAGIETQIVRGLVRGARLDELELDPSERAERVLALDARRPQEARCARVRLLRQHARIVEPF